MKIKLFILSALALATKLNAMELQELTRASSSSQNTTGISDDWVSQLDLESAGDQTLLQKPKSGSYKLKKDSQVLARIVELVLSNTQKLDALTAGLSARQQQIPVKPKKKCQHTIVITSLATLVVLSLHILQTFLLN